MLTLFCYVRNDDYRGVFIDKVMYVGDLKDGIKEKTKPIFDDIPDYSLLIWMASVECSQNLKEDVEELYLGQNLEAYEILSDISWSGLGEKRIHVIVDRLQTRELHFRMSLLSFLNCQQLRVTLAVVCVRVSLALPFTIPSKPYEPDFLLGHSRQETQYLYSVMAQKPVWTSGPECCSWADLG